MRRDARESRREGISLPHQPVAVRSVAVRSVAVRPLTVGSVAVRSVAEVRGSGQWLSLI